MHGVNRRDFLNAVAALLAAPLPAEAQQAGKIFRIGYLSAPTRESVEGIFARPLRREDSFEESPYAAAGESARLG